MMSSSNSCSPEQRLIRAVLNGRYDVILRILQNDNVDVNYNNDNNRSKKNTSGRCYTALRWACCKGNVDVVALLLEYGADTYNEDYNGWTPLHWACYKGHFDVVKLLVEHMKLNNNTTDKMKDDRTENNNDSNGDIVRLMIQPPPLFYEENKNKSRKITPVQIARDRNHMDIVSYLQTPIRQLAFSWLILNNNNINTYKNIKQ